MTRDEWESCTDPAALLKFHTERTGGPSERQARLVLIALCRLAWDQLTDERSRHAVEIAEAYVEGQADADDRRVANHKAEDAYDNSIYCPVSWAGRAAIWVADHKPMIGLGYLFGDVWATDVKQILCDVFRDICGRPFNSPRFARSAWECKVCGARPDADGEVTHGKGCYQLDENGGGSEWVEEDSPLSRWLAWNDGVVPKMVERIYHEQRWDEVAILADALEEAGCTDVDMLGHLRNGKQHWRGCWPIDTLLGKE